MFENSQIHILQSLLLFSAYHLQSQIVYWISNIGLSGSQYAGGRRRRRGTFWKGSKILVEMKIGGKLIVGWEGGALTGQFDCSQTLMNPAKTKLQFQVGQNNVMLQNISFKILNVFVHIAKCICVNHKIYLSTMQNVLYRWIRQKANSNSKVDRIMLC